MQFLVIVSSAVPPPAQRPTIEERELESEIIRTLYSEGMVRQMWLRAEGGACMIAESDSADTLAARLGALPLVQSGFLMTPQISALKPYPGFGPQASK